MKNRFFILGMPVTILVLGMMVAGCATTHHSVEISNVSNIRELYIRNAGAVSWGTNIVGDIKSINKSNYSERVDIKVVDSNGIVYSKLNVPFGNTAFVETNKTSTPNIYALGALGLIVILIYSLAGGGA